MPNILNRRDLDFILYDILKIDRLCAYPRHAAQDRGVFDQIIDAAEKLAEEKLQPVAALVDAQEPAFDAGRAVLPEETRDALAAIVEGGFLAAGFDESWGGLELPYIVTQAVAAYFGAANGGVAGYGMLTIAAANLLAAHGDEAQKQAYLPGLVEGRFFGTMCLSEPQAGSSLADIRTRAERQADGSYRLHGSKMWISGGDHDASENIIHFVLAKTGDPSLGVKGISLFIAPRLLLGDDGAPGARNDVTLVGLNHKMGNRATVNTVLNFGDEGGAVGFLVGEEGRGLAYMFHMMNEARIGVGLAAAVTAYTGYLHALDYAKERRQGRPIKDRDPTSPMIPIIEHADVKRMLLQQKAYSEGALHLCLYGAMLVDLARNEPDPSVREHLEGLLELLTPVIKSWPSEYGLRANDLAIQVHGGYGYTREYAVERLYRDNRLNPIHEGTKGIQGIDLLGRKVRLAGGGLMALLDGEIATDLAEATQTDGLGEATEAVRSAWAALKSATEEMHGQAGASAPDLLLANATLYLDVFGHVVVGWLWLKQAHAVAGRPDAFARGKRQACQYFCRYE
ncbi:MAG: acyl-CoA dehydrogenase, partial [Pseudomonadota bacterium]